MDAATRSGGGVSAIVEYDYTAKEPDELDLIKGAMIHNVKQMPGGWWEGTLNSNGKTGMFPDNFVRVIDMNEETTVTLRDKSATTNRRCKVIYSYTQVNDDELSLAVGDVIEFLGEVEEGWWRGRLKTKVGVFPSNFVVAIEQSPILASKRPPSLAPTTQATSAAKTTAASSNNIKSTTTTNSAAAAALAALSTKKTNRLSFHSSKEDLLNFTTSSSSASSATNTTTAATTAVEDAAPSLPPKPQRDFCRVEYPYAPQNEDELELKVGDVITVISMELADKGWWKGELRGKVGVFPDNFVKLMSSSEVSPLHEPQQSHRTAKNSKTIAATSSNSTNITSSATSSTTISNSTAAATTSKVFIKKSGSTSSTQSSNRKDSFGSRDSLNDILSETGLPSGNVAAQRKSLENKNLDLSNAPDASTRLGLKKPPQLQQLQETKTILNSSSSNNSSSTSTTTTTTSSILTGMTSNSSTGELRKSLENMDEKTKSPPPVLTKKPSVPTKKSTTVTSVAGNLLSGLKQKVKNVESKLTTAASHDAADGIGSSKMSPGGLPDSGPSGHVLMRRAATIAVEDSDFDRVERSSILPDMRAGRVKAPKRRPPSAAINVIGESNNNNSIYLNGSGGGTASGSELLSQYDDAKPQSSDDNSTGEEQLAKPKPREWEKKKAPWMEELKASQVKKKSPNVEPRSLAGGGLGGVGGSSLADRTSKLLGDDMKITSSSNSLMGGGTSVIASSSSTTSSNVSSSTSTKVQSSSISSSIMQQSMTVESSQQLIKKELSSASATDAMAKSMINKHASEATTTPPVPSVEDVRARPNSLSIRNRSISPSLLGTRTAASALKTSASSNVTEAPASSSTTLNNSNSSSATTTSNNSSSVTSTAAKTTIVNNHHHHSSTIHENNIKHSAAATASGEGGGRVVELEKRVEKLESVVHAQQRTIDELVRTLREETDRVKVLRGELDKYAQCVTQV